MPLPTGNLLGSEEVQQNVSTRFEQACEELKLKGERQRADKAAKEEAEARAQAKVDLEAPMKDRLKAMRDSDVAYGTDMYAQMAVEQEERDGVLEDDTELDKLRQARMEQLKKQKNEHETNIAKGHGEYDEVFEDAFLTQVIASKFAVVHFYHDDFERCKLMDKHLKLLARKHIETRFFKINAEKTPFFVEKLSVRTLPTLIFFQDGKAIDRLLGFQGFETADDFPTRELEERIGLSGVIRMERSFYEEQLQENKPAQKPKIFATKTEDFDDPFDE